MKSGLEEYFKNKPREFWKNGIMRLPERWQKVVEKDHTLFKKGAQKEMYFILTFYLKNEKNYPDNLITIKNSLI